MNHVQILNSLTSTIVNLVFPVGSIYMTTNNAITDPVTLLPNTKLEQIKDRFIWYSNTAWQGGRSKKISSNQMPPHNHYYEHVDPYDRMGNPDGSKDTSGGYAANESY